MPKNVAVKIIQFVCQKKLMPKIIYIYHLQIDTNDQ